MARGHEFTLQTHDPARLQNSSKLVAIQNHWRVEQVHFIAILREQHLLDAIPHMGQT